MELKQGDVVFFPEAAHNARGKKKKAFRFKGHGYGVLLGVVPEGLPEPPIEVVIAALGSIGYVKLDDIKEFAGETVANRVMKLWQEKYTKRINELAQKAIDEGRIRLIGTDGKLLERDPHVPLEIAEDGTVTKVGGAGDDEG